MGPAVSVLNDVARSNGLGRSLIERLLLLYEKGMSLQELKHSRYSLLTNYRCHMSILTLASALFYDSTLESRSMSQTHSLAPYPIVFYCSSLEHNNYNTSTPTNQQEARLLVNKAVEFVQMWPNSGERVKPSIVLMAGSNAQVYK